MPKPLRAAFANTLLFHGRECVLYRSFVPPELDERGHAQLLRLHLFVSPLGTTYLSPRLRVIEALLRRLPFSSSGVLCFHHVVYRLANEPSRGPIREAIG